MAHSAPLSNRDFDFFYEGLEQGQLLIQRCSSCGTRRAPPGPCCAKCGSMSWSAIPVEGSGTLYSYTVHYYPPLPGFKTPHPVGLVDLNEGVRLVGGLDDVPIERIQIGMPLRLEFCRRGGVASFRFRESNRQTTAV